VALVGIGGYGNNYVSALLDAPPQQASQFRFVAAIDPSPNGCRRLPELQARGIGTFRALEEFHGSGGHADLVAISTPLHLHANQTIAALAHGSHVLCEKPLCVVPADAVAMAQARDAAGRQVAIGYQWSFSEAIQRLKRDILAGRFGRPKRARCLVLWPRDERYYLRNRWAGAKHDAQGNPVLDSPVNNACAHYLHNLFYLLGPSIDRSDQPAQVTAELYRANPIENYDTAVVRCQTEAATEILFVVSHAVKTRRGPIFSCEFENATVNFADQPGATITVRLADGSSESYGSPNDNRYEKLWASIRSARDNTPTVCGIEAASAHTNCAWAAQHSAREIIDFPRELIETQAVDGSRRRWVVGLSDVLEQCYSAFELPSGFDIPWATDGRKIMVNDPPSSRADSSSLSVRL
jgi:predicted dehydrogenase